MSESKYFIDDGQAAWRPGQKWDHTNHLGDERLFVNQMFVPNNHSYMQPQIGTYQLPKSAYSIAGLVRIEPEKVNDTWDQRARFEWHVSYGREEFKFPGASGYFECDICAQFYRTALAFNLFKGRELKLTVGSDQVALVGLPLVRWLMPDQRSVGMLRVLIRQAYRLLAPVNFVEWVVNLHVSFQDTSSTSGDLVDGDMVRTDLSAAMDVEWGYIKPEE